jgi:phosphoglycolate phosphatase
MIRRRFPRFVVWDLDGTLADTLLDITAAANAARVFAGLTALPPEQIRPFVGEGAQRLVDQALGEDLPASVRSEALAHFHAYYREHVCVHAQPYPGVDALVRRLAGGQAIATNKPGDTARRLVSALGWDGLFSAVVGASDVQHRKPAPDAVWSALDRSCVAREDALFVGDSPIDIDTAAAAGVDFACVTWGLRPRRELVRAPVLVDDVSDLERLIFG